MKHIQKTLHQFFAANDSNSLAYNDFLSLFSQEGQRRHSTNLFDNNDNSEESTREEYSNQVPQDFLLHIGDDQNNQQLEQLATLIEKNHHRQDHNQDALRVYQNIEAESQRMISLFEEAEAHRATNYKIDRTSRVQHYVINLRGSLNLYQKDSPIYQATLTHIEYYEGELATLQGTEE